MKFTPHFRYFSFKMNFEKTVVRNLAFAKETLEVRVVGTANFYPAAQDPEERFSFDLECVLYNDVDVAPLLSFVDGLDQVEEQALRLAPALFQLQTN